MPCNQCGSRASTVIYETAEDRRHWIPGTFGVVGCNSCGLVRTEPRPTREAIGAFYPASYSPYLAEDPEARSALYAAVRRVARLPYTLRYGPLDAPMPVGAANRVLDVGCGSGLFLKAMARAGWDPWGVEPSEPVARAALERLGVSPERIKIATVEDVEFESTSFDLVALAHVLEHLHDPKAVLERIHDWLRPGGTVRIWAPNFASLESRVFRRCWFALDVPRHLFHFTPATLCRMVESCGFTVERVIPQYQVNTLSQSVPILIDRIRGRRRDLRDSMALYYGLLPVATTLLAFGSGGAIDLTASKPRR